MSNFQPPPPSPGRAIGTPTANPATPTHSVRAPAEIGAANAIRLVDSYRQLGSHLTGTDRGPVAPEVFVQLLGGVEANVRGDRCAFPRMKGLALVFCGLARLVPRDLAAKVLSPQAMAGFDFTEPPPLEQMADVDLAPLRSMLETFKHSTANEATRKIVAEVEKRKAARELQELQK